MIRKIINWFKSLFEKKEINVEIKEKPGDKIKRIKKNVNILRRYNRAMKNQNKCWATTKGFNNIR